MVNGDGLHTVSQRRLIRQIGVTDDEVVDAICTAIAIALGRDGP